MLNQHKDSLIQLYMTIAISSHFRYLATYVTTINYHLKIKNKLNILINIIIYKKI